MYMRFYWVHHRIAQKHFLIYWAPGSSTSLGDYHTKHHAGKHHQLVRPIYLHEPTSQCTIPQSAIVGLRRCVNPPVRMDARAPMTQTPKATRGMVPRSQSWTNAHD
jgi:hypothetical protein